MLVYQRVPNDDPVISRRVVSSHWIPSLPQSIDRCGRASLGQGGKLMNVRQLHSLTVKWHQDFEWFWYILFFFHRYAFFAVWDTPKFSAQRAAVAATSETRSGRGALWRKDGSPKGRLLSTRARTLNWTKGRGSSLKRSQMTIWY